MKVECAHTELVDIDLIQANPRNPNKHPENQIKLLAKIMKHQGWRSPVVISNRSGFVVKGHGRIEAAKLNAWTKAPVDRQDYASEADEYADMVADNKIAELAETDMGLIYEDALKIEGLDFDLLGIPDFQLTEVLEPGCGEDDVPKHVEPKTKLGDLYKLSNHRLMCGDSTNIQHVERLMNGEKADMVFTDPPYNQAESGGKNDLIGKALHKQTESISHMINFEPESFLNILPTLFNKNLNSYVFTSKDLLPDYLKWAKDAGYSFNVLIWKKPSAIPIGGSYRPDVEYLLVLRKSGIFNSGLSEVNYSKVIECNRDSAGLHPTMKPIEVIENQLKIASNKNSIVADLFGGSGSTLIACEKTNRKCFMMELDPHYVDVIVARWEKYTGKKAELIDG